MIHEWLKLRLDPERFPTGDPTIYSYPISDLLGLSMILPEDTLGRYPRLPQNPQERNSELLVKGPGYLAGGPVGEILETVDVLTTCLVLMTISLIWFMTISPSIHQSQMMWHGDAWKLDLDKEFLRSWLINLPHQNIPPSTNKDLYNSWPF